MPEGPETVDELAAAFCDRSLPGKLWTHAAHLRVGLWHVNKYGADQALDLLRERIRAYNESRGQINSDTDGYHETLTRFYVLIIDGYLKQADAQRPLDELGNELVARFSSRDLPLVYYSRDVLWSTEARGWVEPDVQPIEGKFH